MKTKSLIAKLALSLTIPLLLVGGVELVLRLTGQGYPTRFLLSADIAGKPHWINNPFYGYRFFDPQLARNPAPLAIEQTPIDPPTTVVVLGESAAQGDPMLEFGMPRMLEKLLNHMDSSTRYQVVNGAMTAINSPVIVDIARDLAALKPELAVIYMGNNEVVGPFGPGTVFTSFPGLARWTPFRVWLSTWKLSQLRYWFAGPARQQWTGLDLFAGIHLPEGAPELEPMYHAFERNLNRIIDQFEQHGTRVLLCTVAVNLADCPPFGSGDESAASAYREGKELEAAGRHDEALARLRKARDLDTQRFRTDSRLNRITRETAARREVELLDIEALFDQVTGTIRAPGAELFLDHVHFTFTGTWELARSIAATLLNQDRATTPSLADCREWMFFTPWAERQQASVMLSRRKTPPLKNQANNPERSEALARQVAACSEQIDALDLGTVEATYRTLRAAEPQDFFLPFHWGAILAESGRWRDAVPPLTNGLARLPLHFEARILPATALCRAGKPEEGARVMVGTSPLHGFYLADYAGQVMHSLAQDGYPAEARRFQAEVLRLAPQFPLRDFFAGQPVENPGQGGGLYP
ncbi:MAG: hypothetical protein H7A43_02875 [Verrucomicrobia bacterium]|nr:hypothetical protein [Kiritimatiellia bacterium]MCP5487568.1 hypothetical protein [Verrucomicrobiota bacterium]